MQIFEPIVLKESPYMELREIFEGNSVKDVITEKKVYLIVDHDSKRIWTYNGIKSSFILQFYGGILAGELRKQLKLFYRVHLLNKYSKSDDIFKQVMEKPLGAGRAKPILKEELSSEEPNIPAGQDMCVHPGLKVNKALELINDLPKLEDFERRLMIIGGNIYTDEEITKKFLTDEKTEIKPKKMGRLNRGFTFFGDLNYSSRILIQERKVQGIELYLPTQDTSKEKPLEVKVPIFSEEKLRTEQNMEQLENAFNIPESLPDIEEDPSESQK